MRSKTVSLMAIRNGTKRTISASGGLELLQMVSELDASGGLELLQMVSELDVGRCANADAGPSRGGGV